MPQQYIIDKINNNILIYFGATAYGGGINIQVDVAEVRTRH